MKINEMMDNKLAENISSSDSENFESRDLDEQAKIKQMAINNFLQYRVNNGDNNFSKMKHRKQVEQLIQDNYSRINVKG